jgi:hypothetical protein
MRRAGTLRVIALVLGAPVAARAQGGPWERAVRDGLKQAITTLGGRGYRSVGAPEIGTLNTDESAAFTLRLRAGTRYTVIGTCDPDCVRLNLVVSNAAGNDLAVDRSTTTAPIVLVTPRDPGLYRVQVVMAACRMNPCWYGVAAYLTPPAP